MNYKDYFNKYFKKRPGADLRFGSNIGLEKKLKSITRHGRFRNLRDNMPAIIEALKKRSKRIRRGDEFTDKQLRRIRREIGSKGEFTKDDKRDLNKFLKFIGKENSLLKKRSAIEKVKAEEKVIRDLSAKEELIKKKNIFNRRIEGENSGAFQQEGGRRFSGNFIDNHRVSALSSNNESGVIPKNDKAKPIFEKNNKR